MVGGLGPSFTPWGWLLCVGYTFYYRLRVRASVLRTGCSHSVANFSVAIFSSRISPSRIFRREVFRREFSRCESGRYIPLQSALERNSGGRARPGNACPRSTASSMAKKRKGGSVLCECFGGKCHTEIMGQKKLYKTLGGNNDQKSKDKNEEEKNLPCQEKKSQKKRVD